MRVRVVFRVDAETGDVQEFLIEDISTEVEPEHDAVHDRIAHEVGKVVERRPAPHQVLGGVEPDATPLTYRPGEEPTPVDERAKATE
jgi:hypothetical protein